MNPDPARPLPDTIRGWLDQVPDPEIPAISVMDLGIVRDLAWQDGTLVVTVTPTYSGCPATSVIEHGIASALHARGIGRLRLERRLAPPWTTGWLSEKGRAKLEACGIAPPRSASGPERCPQCKSTALERVSQFGSTPCKAQWRCLTCLEPFDHFKCI